MDTLRRCLHALSRESGQGMTEYIIIVGLVAIAAIGVVTVFGDNVRSLFGAAADGLNGTAVKKVDTREAGGTKGPATIKDFGAHVGGK